MARYHRPERLTDALELLAGAPLSVLAGGTDHFPARVGQPLDDDVLDITGIAALDGIEEGPETIWIGALTRWSTLRDARLPPWLHGLQLAAAEVGGWQIQNAGTLGGNLCNASPAADGVPPLLALDARVELRAQTGTEELPLADFITGNRTTRRRPDQLLAAVLIPKPQGQRASAHFEKLGARRYLVISIVMVAATIEAHADRIERARIAVGAASAVAKRLPEAEAALAGARLDDRHHDRLGAKVQPKHLACLRPLDDIRGTAGYRLDAGLTLVRRTLEAAARKL